MVKLALDRDTILKRINGIQNEVNELEKISKIPFEPEEIYRIINDNLGDFDIFLMGVKGVLENPERFGIKSSKI